MATALLIFQWFNLVGSAVTIAIAATCAWRQRDARPLLVFPALWCVFGVIYYGLLLSGRLSPDAVLMWGAAHRTMAIIMVLGGVCALWAIVATPATLPDGDDDSE